MTTTSPFPEHPGLTAYAELAGSLQLLNCTHIAEFVLAGQPPPFRVLDGVFVKSGPFYWRRADSSYLEQIRLDWNRNPDRRRRAAADHVIDLLQHAMAENPQALRQLALFQIRKLLPAPGGPELPRGLLRDKILELGVADDEADQLAVAVADARDAPAPGTVVQVIAARQSRQLRRAARLAKSLEPASRDHVLLAFLDAIRADSRRAEDLITAGGRLRDSGDLEAAAACYLRAASLAADEPRIAEGLRQCPPPPPRGLTAEVAGHRINLSWQPSLASAGTITYRVTRDSEPVAEVANGPQTTAVDADPPKGSAISYRVVAVREARVESVAAVTARMRLTPDVADLVVTEQRGRVVARWQVPPQVAEVCVTKHSDAADAPGERIAVRPDRTCFVDDSVTGGTTYLYRVTCGYRDLDGSMAWSSGRVVTVSASRWPDLVRSLQATAGPRGDTVRLQWLSPGTGEILIVLGPSEMPPEGTELATSDAGTLGAVTWRGDAAPLGTPMECEIPVHGAGVHHLAVVTALDQRAVAGTTRVIDVLDGFQGLYARRAGEGIELKWAWPASSSATLATVRWDCTGEEEDGGSALRVSRDSYRRRGVTIPARGCGYRLTVSPLSTIDGSLSLGPPATDELEPQYDLAYEVLRTRRVVRTGRVATLRVAKLPTAPLEFLLVARPGTLRPTRIAQGTVVLRVSAAAIDEGAAVEHRIDLSAMRPPYYLLGFLTGPAASQFRLVHPARGQLLVER
jgi:hypothetical protein